MCTGSGSDPESSSNGWSRARGLVVKTLVLIGGALLLKRLTKSTTRRDHARVVSRSLTGEKVYSQFLCSFSLLSTYTYLGLLNSELGNFWLIFTAFSWKTLVSAMNFSVLA